MTEYEQWIKVAFSYHHLPPELQQISQPYCELALRMHADLPPNRETSTALRKLVESRDCAIRAHLMGVA